MVAAARKLTMPEAGSAATAPMLGIHQSARGLRWQSRLDDRGANLATAISQRHGLPELLGRVIAARGATLDGVDNWLNPTLKALMPDPATLQDMPAAAARLADAIIGRQRIAVFGDYDVDGACSSALMKRFFSAHGIDARIYIPDRITEGYGPNPAAINELIDGGAQLIVTVDCGTTSFDTLAIARGRGIDAIVIDHHQADAALPPVHAVVNPNRQDDLSGLGHLCAAGVVFMVLVAVTRELRSRGHYTGDRREPPLLEWLDMVALATVCDVVPLAGLNRAYVVKGLQVLRSRNNRGLKALADAAGLDQPPTPYHLGFVLGPRINAGGRIGDAALGAKLLSSDDPIETGRIAVLLDKLNKERKALETEILEAATVRAATDVEADPQMPIVITGSEDWHKGLVGLVASRLTERFGRPSLVIAWTRNGDGSPGEGTGSLRSIGGVDIGAAVRAAVSDGLLIKGGGHAMAAGLTLARDKLPALKAFFSRRLEGATSAARDAAALDIDGALTPRAVNDELIDLIERAGPFGQGNPQPRFVFPAHRLKGLRVMNDAHIRVSLEAADGARIDAVAFRCVGSPLGDALLGANGLPLHVAGHLRRDSWGGREKIEVMIEDVADPRSQ